MDQSLVQIEKEQLLKTRLLEFEVDLLITYDGVKLFDIFDHADSMDYT